MNKDSRELLKQLSEFVCITETPDGDLLKCKHGCYPDCGECGFGCYKLLREAEKRIEFLDSVRKMALNLWGGQDNDTN